MKQILIVILMLTTLAVIAACAPPPPPVAEPNLPNPASVHCADQGGKLEIRDEAGGQVGYCLFDDGSECEEWAFFKGECAPGGGEGRVGMPNPASVHCADQGGKLEIRDEAGGQVGYCLFDDGSECEEWAFMRGECAPGGSYQPLDSAECTDLADAMSKTVGVDVTTETAAFDDYVKSEKGSGCQATATGTGADFESFPVVAAALKEMLAAKGWDEDMQYAADGPTGTGAGFHEESRLCLLRVGWAPSEDADCPSDQPISACKLAPEQQLYTIVLNCAQTGAQEPNS